MIKKTLKVLSIILLIITIIVVYSRYIATTGLITNEIKLENQNINSDFDGLKIVHFSDLHYKRIITKKRIDKIINEINIINPDIIIFTGDLIDNGSVINKPDIKYLKETLNKLNSKYGKYAVLGNHDYSTDIETIREIYNNSDFQLLENEYDIIYSKNNQKLYIGGISTGEFNEDIINNLKIEENIYKIMLLHEPDFIDNINTLNMDLALSGHSHNGQINIPYVKKLFLPKGAKKYYEEHYTVNNTNLYISNGIGVSRVNFRLFNTPSINFYRLNKD